MSSLDDFEIVYGELKRYHGNRRKVVIPDSVEKIGASAFSGCEYITSVEVPEKVTEIGMYAFAQCYRLQSINIPQGIKEITSGVFHNCEKLMALDIPDSVEKIYGQAFTNCSSLGRVSFHSKPQIAKTAFDKFSNHVWFDMPYSFPNESIRNHSVSESCKLILSGEYRDEQIKVWRKYIQAQRKRLYALALSNNYVLQYMVQNEVISADEID